MVNHNEKSPIGERVTGHSDPQDPDGTASLDDIVPGSGLHLRNPPGNRFGHDETDTLAREDIREDIEGDPGVDQRESGQR